jgi:hypothetical protein
MNEKPDLFLTEEVLLLALRDREGTVASGAWYHHSLAGAVMAELAVHGRIRMEGAKERVQVLDATPIGDPVIDACLAELAASKKDRKPSDWFMRFANKSELPHDVAAGLVRRGILRADKGKVALIFTRRIYPEVDPEPERALLARLHTAIFEDKASLDTRTIVLVSLTNRTGVLTANFDRKELKARKKHIEAMIEGELTGTVAEEAIQTVQAIMFITTMMPIFIVTTT